MKVAMLAPIAWATPPAAYGPWEQVTSNITEGLVRQGIDVTLFATGTSRTAGKLIATVRAGYEEQPGGDVKVMEYSHIGQVMARAGEFDIIHNQFDFMPLAFSPHVTAKMVTTVHGFGSERIVPIYERFNDACAYVSISDSNRHAKLKYAATVYNGIDTDQFTVRETPGDYLLYFGRIHPEKGAAEAIEVAHATGKRLLLAGLIQDEPYYRDRIAPFLGGEQITYLGNVGPDRRNELMGGALGLLHLISFDEPFGLSVAEAMMTGTPVVAINRGSMPELIEQNKTGFLVPNTEAASDAVRKLASIDRGYTAEVARSRFSLDRMVDGYVSVYEHLLGQ